MASAVIFACEVLSAGRCERNLIEAELQEIQSAFDQGQVAIHVARFSMLEPAETLQQHVMRMMALPDGCIGPASEEALVYKSPHQDLPQLKAEVSLTAAAKWVSGSWRDISTFIKEWKSILKSLASGVYSPLVTRGVHFGILGSYESRVNYIIHWPIIIRDSDGSRWWGMLTQTAWMAEEMRKQWSFRDILTVKHSQSSISVISMDNGCMLWQNPASMQLYGNHGRFNSELRPFGSTDEGCGSKFNFIDLVFGSEEAQVQSASKNGGTYRSTLEVKNTTLRSLIRLGDKEEMHLDSQVSQTCDPHSLEKVYVLSQIDITAAVVSQRELRAEKAKTHELLLRQRELIDCLTWLGEVGQSTGGDARALQLINSIRRQMSASSASLEEELSRAASDSSASGFEASTVSSSHQNDVIELGELLGKGSFGQVYQGTWKGQQVAVKSIVLPLQASEKKDQMALMEAAIASSPSLEHPNIVKTHSFSIKPIRDPRRSLGSSSHLSQGPIKAFEVQLVLEYCDLGTLQCALSAFQGPNSPHYSAILEVALDIARGMMHLHSCNIIHADLKPSNILLLTSASDERGFTAKISDFGLSITKIDAQETHVSNMFQGTLSHMSPEALLTGQQSNAGDVYSFGITLYELYTATQAFKNIPASLLGHKIARDHLRPTFPTSTPSGFQELAESCWDAISFRRPDFTSIVSTLLRLREAEGRTQPIDLSVKGKAAETELRSLHMSQIPSGMIMLSPVDESRYSPTSPANE
jgi:serine/threonine protein kinase